MKLTKYLMSFALASAGVATFTSCEDMLDKGNSYVIYADTEFDNSPYDACWLDTPLWTFTALPKIGERLTSDRLEQLPALIASCLSEQRYADGRKEVMDETWCCRGEGAARAAEYLIAKYKELSNKGDNKL